MQHKSGLNKSHNQALQKYVFLVSQEERPIFLERIVSAIVRKNLHKNMRLILNFHHRRRRRRRNHHHRRRLCNHYHHYRRRLNHYHHHISVMELGPLLTRSGLTYLEVSSKVCHDSFCQLGNSVSLPWVIHKTCQWLKFPLDGL